jgi:hypothetical protein
LRRRPCAPIARRLERDYSRAMDGTFLSIFMLAGIAFTIGGGYLLLARKDMKRGWLMLTAAMVMFANVAVWTVPMK